MWAGLWSQEIPYPQPSLSENSLPSLACLHTNLIRVAQRGTDFLKLGQDPDISRVAKTYIIFTIPELLAQAALQPMRSFLRTQGLTSPLSIAAIGAVVLHLPINYIFAIHLKLGIKGVALALACKRRRNGHTRSNNIVVIRVPVRNELQPDNTSGARVGRTPALSSSMDFHNWHHNGNWFWALGCCCNDPVEIIVGENVHGRPSDSRLDLSRTSDLGLCEIGNSPQTAACGVLTGTARPKDGVRINLFSFYVVGLPVAILVTFKFQFGFRGLWFGLLAAQVSCVCLMVYTLIRTDWKHQAKRAEELTLSAGDNGDLETGLISSEH
ncbi:hypothetical protein JRO89_XS12G0084300 [Xanthoceras sorbifolium]|uniref:Uncharacterized protein n=1 Tax=Xanthoceras sorbifolium TaxID=99658 RepID=A0ABQ8HBU0_9ROSI|nr:hypothetical protein JRO89_XS12G0084300 [Xanthoceras sorbifolium]